jgi:phosphoserine phosphatase
MDQGKKIISLSAIGVDSPGLVSKITTKIFEMKGNVTDIEENCRRGLFSISLAVDFSASNKSTDEIISRLKTIEMETDLKLILETRDTDKIAPEREDENYVVTVLGLDRLGIISRISTFFHKYHINIENCRMIARGKFFSTEMAIDTGKMITGANLSHNESIKKMSGELKDLCAEMDQSVVIQKENTFKKQKKIVVFDVESTLIQSSSLRDFAEKIMRRSKLADSKVKSGVRLGDDKSGQAQELIENASALKGMSIRDFEKLSETLTLNPGAFELIQILKSMGFKIALLSAGFDCSMKKIFEISGADYAFSNTLKVDQNEIITGKLEEPVLTNGTKNEILEMIMGMENIRPDQVIAVGDGPALSRLPTDIGLTIAFRPEETATRADGIFSGDQIINILYCLGVPKTELDKYLKKIP